MRSRAILSDVPSVRVKKRRAARRQAAPQLSAESAPATVAVTSMATRFARYAHGRAIAVLGSCNIVIGLATRNQLREANGHRQRVVGVLQVNCGVDRRTAEAFVRRWLARQPLPTLASQPTA